MRLAKALFRSISSRASLALYSCIMRWSSRPSSTLRRARASCSLAVSALISLSRWRACSFFSATRCLWASMALRQSSSSRSSRTAFSRFSRAISALRYAICMSRTRFSSWCRSAMDFFDLVISSRHSSRSLAWVRA